VDLGYNITGFHISYFTRPPLDVEAIQVRQKYIERTGKKIASHFKYRKLAIIARVLNFNKDDLLSLNECEIEAWLQVIKELTDEEQNQQKHFIKNISKEFENKTVSQPATINKPNFLM